MWPAIKEKSEGNIDKRVESSTFLYKSISISNNLYDLHWLHCDFLLKD